MHWTGTEQRLKRDLKPRFDTKAYAAEEFVAESGAAFLCAHLEVIHVPPGILEVAGGDAGQITDRQQRIQASLYLHHLNLPQLHDDLLGRQFLSAFSLSSPGYVLSFRLVHMWNGPASKCFLQMFHRGGTVRSYVRPISAALTAGLDEVRDARG